MNMNIIASNPLLQNAQAEALGTPTKEIKGRPNPAFQPETTVDLESSVKTALQTLNKALNKQSNATKALPTEIQKIIGNIMKNSFSLEGSVSQGLTSALQGQRASTEQLNVLGKILSRLSMSLQSNNKLAMSENLQTLLNSLKLADGQAGKLLETSTLHKSFMQLMDGKPLSELPKELQVLLRGSGAQTAQQLSQPAAGGSLAALQQLIKQLMPSLPLPQQKMMSTAQQANNTANSPQANSSAAAQAGQNQTNQTMQTGQNGQTSQTGQANQAAANQAATTAAPKVVSMAQAGILAEGLAEAGSKQTGEMAASAKSSASQKQNAAQDGAPIKAAPEQAAAKSAQGRSSAGQVGGELTAKEIMQSMKTALSAAKNSGTPLKSAGELFTALSSSLQMAGAKKSDPNAALLRALLTTRPLQNTPELMQTVKTMARQLLAENQGLLPEAAKLELQTLSEAKQAVLPEKEARALQELVRVIQQNLPYAVKNVAVKHNMPEAVKVWTMAQLSELVELQSLSEREVMKAGKSVNDFMTLLKTSINADAQTQGVEKSMVMMMPIYLGENDTLYPSYIHIFHQQNENARGDIEKKETWFRVCMLTDNVGAVELVFRMYGRRMDMKLAFSDEEAAIYFPYYMQDIRESFRELNIQLADVKINVIGDVDEL